MSPDLLHIAARVQQLLYLSHPIPSSIFTLQDIFIFLLFILSSGSISCFDLFKSIFGVKSTKFDKLRAGMSRTSAAFINDTEEFVVKFSMKRNQQKSYNLIQNLVHRSSVAKHFFRLFVWPCTFEMKINHVNKQNSTD